MPHKPAPKVGEMPVFVSVSLTVDLKPQLAQWAERNIDDLWKHVEQALYEDYAFSCKAESKTGFQASLRSTEDCKNTSNKGKVLVERASTPTRAVMRLFWAHLEQFDKTWPKGDRVVDDDW